MRSELARLLRLLKPQKIATLTPRLDSELPFAAAESVIGPPLMLDTCVYLDVLQGRAPEAIKALLNARHVFHSSGCLEELAHVFGRLDPADPRTKRALAAIRNLIDRAIPAHRLSAPDASGWMTAGIVAGVVSRIRGHTADGRLRYLDDAMIYAHAARMGCVVLTRNIRDFDFIDQIMPSGGILLYR